MRRGLSLAPAGRLERARLADGTATPGEGITVTERPPAIPSLPAAYMPRLGGEGVFASVGRNFSPYLDPDAVLDYLDDVANRWASVVVAALLLHIALFFALSPRFTALERAEEPDAVRVEIVTFEPVEAPAPAEPVAEPAPPPPPPPARPRPKPTPPPPPPEPQPEPEPAPVPPPPPPPPLPPPEPEPEPVAPPPPPPEILVQEAPEPVPDPVPQPSPPEPLPPEPTVEIYDTPIPPPELLPDLPPPPEPQPVVEPVPEPDPLPPEPVAVPTPEPIVPEPLPELPPPLVFEPDPVAEPEPVLEPVFEPEPIVPDPVVEPEPFVPEPVVPDPEPLPEAPVVIAPPEPLPDLPPAPVAPAPVEPEPDPEPEIVVTEPVILGPTILASPDAPTTQEEADRAVPQEQAAPLSDLITGRPTLPAQNPASRGAPARGLPTSPPTGPSAGQIAGGTRRASPGAGGWTLSPVPSAGAGYDGMVLDMRCRELTRSHADCPEYVQGPQGRDAGGFEAFTQGRHGGDGVGGVQRATTSQVGRGARGDGIWQAGRGAIGSNSVNAGGPSTTVLDDTDFGKEFLGQPVQGGPPPGRVRDLILDPQDDDDWELEIIEE